MVSHNEMYDVIVVGAGPAGATAAKELANKGHKVLLIDKAKFPREKNCGGFIPMKALKQLDFKLPSCYIKNEIRKISVYNHKMKYASYESDSLLGISMSRSDFDHYLLNRAIAKGVRFYEEVRFIGLEKQKDSIQVVTSGGSYGCKYVIGGDGVFSGVRNYIDKKKKIEYYKMGFTVGALIEREEIGLDSDFKLFNIPVFCSMGWAIPWRDKVNIGIGGPWINKQQIINEYKSFSKRVGEIYKVKDTSTRIRGGFLPAGGFSRKVIQDHILLVGDAAGFADPMTGEGLYYAIKSGKLAAEQISQGNVNAYQRICNETIHRSLRKSLLWNLSGMNKIYGRIPALHDRLCENFYHMM